MQYLRCSCLQGYAIAAVFVAVAGAILTAVSVFNRALTVVKQVSDVLLEGHKVFTLKDHTDKIGYHYEVLLAQSDLIAGFCTKQHVGCFLWLLLPPTIRGNSAATLPAGCTATTVWCALASFMHHRSCRVHY